MYAPCYVSGDKKGTKVWQRTQERISSDNGLVCPRG